MDNDPRVGVIVLKVEKRGRKVPQIRIHIRIVLVFVEFRRWSLLKEEEFSVVRRVFEDNSKIMSSHFFPTFLVARQMRRRLNP